MLMMTRFLRPSIIGEDFGQFPVVRTHFKPWIDPFGKGNHILAGCGHPVALLTLFEHVKKLHLLLERKSRERLLDGGNLSWRERQVVELHQPQLWWILLVCER